LEDREVIYLVMFKDGMPYGAWYDHDKAKEEAKELNSGCVEGRPSARVIALRMRDERPQ
jgi:hypothetical protein